MCLSIWIKSHIDEILVFFIAVFLAILISVTVFFIVLTALSLKFPHFFDTYSTALGFAGVVLGLGSFIFIFLGELLERNKKLEAPKENPDINNEIKEINQNIKKIATALNEIKKQ